MLPGLPRVLPAFAHKYPQGLYEVGAMRLYTSKGVGLVSPPARFGCRPEVTIVELAPAS